MEAIPENGSFRGDVKRVVLHDVLLTFLHGLDLFHSEYV